MFRNFFIDDRLKFAVKPFNDIAHSKSIAEATFFQFYNSRFFTYWPKNDCETTNQKGSSSGRFAVTNLKNDQSETQKRVSLAIDVQWAGL